MKTHRIKDTVLAVMCLLLVTPSLVYAFPFLAGADSSYTVMSGSMSPTLKPGDLILVKQTDPAVVEVDDIITVKYETEVFTHRVFEKKFEEGIYLFKTKGDANEDPDPTWLNASQIMGKTVFVIPLGHLYSPYGYTLSFLVPCVLLVGKQIHHVFSLFKRRSKRELRRWRRQKHPVLDTTSVLLLLILVMSGSWLVAPYFQLGSFSYFSDSEWAGVTFTAGTWPTESSHLSIDLSGVYIGGSLQNKNYGLRGINITNTNQNEDVRISGIKVEWETDKGEKIFEVHLSGESVWTGTASSGDELALEYEYVLRRDTLKTMHLFFNSKITDKTQLDGKQFNIQFIMGDDSGKETGWFYAYLQDNNS